MCIVFFTLKSAALRIKIWTLYKLNYWIKIYGHVKKQTYEFDYEYCSNNYWFEYDTQLYIMINFRIMILKITKLMHLSI